MTTFAPGSRARLTDHDLGRFAGDSLFDRLARALCGAGCLPRKELYESWEVARRTRRLFRGGRVVDVAGGHGLLAFVMLLLDDSSPAAVVVDRVVPPSAERIARALTAAWPRLAGRVTHAATALDRFDLLSSDLVVSVHACGALTDEVVLRASRACARVAVLPCCHVLDGADDGGLGGWMAGPAAIDAARALRLRGWGYRIRTGTIPAAITPQNRLLMGEPDR